MTTRRSVAVDTPLGPLYAWAPAPSEVQVATLPATVKHSDYYRHDAAAQRAVETVTIDRTAYTLTATLRAAPPDPRPAVSGHAWRLDLEALCVRCAADQQPASPAIHREVGRLLEPLTGWLAGADGRAFLLGARIDALTAEIHTRMVQLGQHHAELDRLARHRDAYEKISRLTSREREVLALVAEGLSYGQIAERLGLAESTIGQYVHRIRSRLGVHNPTEAAILALQAGLTDLGTAHPAPARCDLTPPQSAR